MNRDLLSGGLRDLVNTLKQAGHGDEPPLIAERLFQLIVQ